MLLWDLLGKFPGTDYESFNYEWIIGKLKELKDSVAAAKASEEIAAESAIAAAASAEQAAQAVETSLFITPEMFGAIGDGVTDDSQAFIDAFEYCLRSEPEVSSYLGCRTILCGPKTYLIKNPIVTASVPTPPGKLFLKGSGTSTAIVLDAAANVLFDNDNNAGFCQIEDLTFVGYNSINSFMNTGGARPQRWKFINCEFRKFHTITKVTSSVDNSEFIWDKCRIVECGVQTTNPCVLFDMQNSQAVNWRFYATEIEQFYGTCIKPLGGSNMLFFGGSIIPFEDSIFADYTGANQNMIGPGNSPTVSMYSCRFELRNAQLIKATDFKGNINMSFDNCGMGGPNITDGRSAIDVTNSFFKLHFNNCWNWNNFKINYSMNYTPNYQESYINFTGSETSVIFQVINNSTITASNVTNHGYVPVVTVNGANYNKNTERGFQKSTGQVINKNEIALGSSVTSSSPAGNKINLPRDGMLSHITLGSIYTTSFGSSIKVIAEVYNASDALIAQNEVVAQSRSEVQIPVKTSVTTGWYVLLKNSSTNNTYAIPHTLTATYLS